MVTPIMPSVPFHDFNKVAMAAIDPDFQSRRLASVPDGISGQGPAHDVELYAPC